MQVQAAPNPADNPNILYKLQRKIKVFDESPLPNRGYNLVTAASKYGIVFIATPSSKLLVYYLKELIDKGCDRPPHISVQLQEKPSHISVNCDQELLAVTGGQFLIIYRVANFQNENFNNALTVRCDPTPSSYVSSIQWNPCMSEVIVLCFSDGTLMVSQVNNPNSVKKVQAKGRCLCWSPKGKQIVVGNSDGSLCQYKPDLSPMKAYPAPDLFQGAPVEAVAVHWISTYQFAVVYRNAADTSRPCATIVNTPKAGQASCINFEDVCYSPGSSRPWYYYLLSVAQWNLILASSSNSMEIATVGTLDASNWQQWMQMDESRPELPLTDKKQENYPVGLTLDTCAIHQLPWGENEVLPPMPLLLVLSHAGWLTLFNVVNLSPGVPQLCAPLQPLVLCPSALQIAPAEPSEPPPPAALPTSQPVLPSYPGTPVPAVSTFGTSGAFSVPVKPVPQAFAPTPQAAAASAEAQHYAELSAAGTPQAAPALPKPTASFGAPPPQAQEQSGQPTPATIAQDTNSMAIKVEQEKAAAVKANQELKAMLIKEANDFQMELYRFLVKSQDVNQEIKADVQFLEASAKLQGLDADQMKGQCSIEILRAAVVQLKLDLVRACAAVAEANTHANAEDLQEWSQADPASVRRLASVKKLAYYIQNQLEQANRVLAHQWSEQDSSFLRGGPGMQRPALEQVYQPLVKQQETLSRQQAMLRALRKTLEQGQLLPGTKSSMLRSTPFRKDPLSKLSRSVLNMSLESDTDKTYVPSLTSQKMDSLRDVLCNHKTIRIKPANIEINHHLASIRLSHERSVLEKAQQAKMKQEQVASAAAAAAAQAAAIAAAQQAAASALNETPCVGQCDIVQKPLHLNAAHGRPTLASVTRTLFTDDVPKPDALRAFSGPTVKLTEIKDKNIPTSNAGSVLVSMLQNKSEVAKNNTFMGQKICSPTTGPFSTQGKQPFSANFGVHPAKSTTTAPEVIESKPAVFAQQLSKPAAQTTQPSFKMPDKASSGTAFRPPSQPSMAVGDLQSAETGEAEDLSKENVENQKVIAQSLTVTAVPKDNKTAPSSFMNVKPDQTAGKNETATNVPDILKVDKLAASSSISTAKSADAVQSVVKDQGQKLPSDNAKKDSTATKAFSFLATAGQSNNDNAGKTSLFGQPTLPAFSIATSAFGTSMEPAKPSLPVSKVAEVSSSSVTKPPVPSAGSASVPSASSTPVPPASSTPVPSASSTPVPSVSSTPPTSASNMHAAQATAAAILASASMESAVSTPAFTADAAPIAKASSVASSLFASANAVVTTATSIFGSPSASSPSSVFGSAAAPMSIFGAGSPAPSSPSSIFGAAAQTSPAASLFAGATQSVFGSPATSPAKPSVFGTPTATTAQTSVFGTPVATTAQSSLFGSPVTTTAASSIFGAPENLFAAASISTTSVTTPTNAGNIFGGGSSSGGSVFGGSGASVFGGAPAFGQSNTAESVFGGAAGFGQQKPASSIWGSGGGTSFGTSFAQKTEASSIFGGGAAVNTTPTQNQTFGSPSTQTSIFGSPNANAPANTSVFGSSQQTTAFGGSPVFGAKTVFGQASGFGGSPSSGGFGAFSGGAANVAQSGFGAPGGFGKPPAFGATPAFGAAPAFGSSATFGSTSPGKAFGSAAPSFGTPTQQSSTFENLAGQNTLTFGNLAQHSPQQAQPAQAFNTSPSFSGWRG